MITRAHRRLGGWLLVLVTIAAFVAVAPARAAPFTVAFTTAEDEKCAAWTVIRPTSTTPAQKICTTLIAPLPEVPPPATVPSGPIKCDGFEQTKVIDATVPTNGNMVRYYVTTRGVFRNNAGPGLTVGDALVVVFKAPAADPIFQLGVTHTGDSNGPQSTRTITLSTKPCDFAYPAGLDAIWSAQSTVMAVKLASGKLSSYARYALEPGRTYYVNVQNWAGDQKCTGRCDVYVSILNNAP